MPEIKPTPSTPSAAAAAPVTPPAAPVAPAASATPPAAPAAPVTPPAAPVAPPSGDPPPAPVTPPVAPPAAEAPPGSWMERVAKYAKGDEKLAKKLTRYSSEEAAMDALLEAQKKISSGALKSALPENATPEQLAAWRAENGIPATYEDYDIQIAEEVNLSPTEEKMFEDFVKAAHEAHFTPAQVEAGLTNLLDTREANRAARDQADINSRIDAEEQLHAEWGRDYVLNVNLIEGMLNSAPAGVADLLKSARGPDGLPVLNNAQTMRWLSNLAREINPIATVTPPGGSIDGLVSELAAIQSLMGDSDSKYWKGPEAKQLQERYIHLVEAKQKYSKKN